MNPKKTWGPLIVLLIFIVHIISFSQSRSEENISSDYPLTMIDAQVTSRKSGQSIGDLNHDNFIVKEDGVRQFISTMERHARALSILVLIDRSIHRGNRPQVEAALRDFQSSLINSITENDELSVMAIADEPMLSLNFTDHKETVRQVLASVIQLRNLDKSPRKTDYEAVFSEASKQMRYVKKPLNRRVIIFFSAISKSEVSAYNVPTTVLNLLLAPTSIFCWYNVIPIDIYPAESPIVNLHGRLSVADLVSLTGGEMEGSGLADVINRLRERYQIGYTPINRFGIGKIHRISLEISPTAKVDRNDLRIIYNKAYISSPRN